MQFRPQPAGECLLRANCEIRCCTTWKYSRCHFLLPTHEPKLAPVPHPALRMIAAIGASNALRKMAMAGGLFFGQTELIERWNTGNIGCTAASHHTAFNPSRTAWIASRARSLPTSCSLSVAAPTLSRATPPNLAPNARENDRSRP